MTLAVIAMLALSMDSSEVTPTPEPEGGSETELRDPASNRLFWMSAGRTAAVKRGSVGLLGAPYLIPWFPYATFLQVGGVPTDFLQLNATGSLGYGSVGAKVQFIPKMGLLLGVAAGADFGFYPQNSAILQDDRIQAYNLAVSFGSEEFAAHVNAMQIIQRNSYAEELIPTYLQLGVSIQLDHNPHQQGKLIAEAWYVNSYSKRQLELGLILAGIRSYGRTFVMEIAFLFGPRLSFGHGSYSNRLEFFPLPYVSLMWFI